VATAISHLLRVPDTLVGHARREALRSQAAERRMQEGGTGGGGGSVEDDDEGSDSSQVERAYLYLIPIPPPFDQGGAPYGHLFRYLACDVEVVPLGLYRNGQLMGAADDYVYTSPQEAAILNPGDRVYVVGQQSRLEPFLDRV